MAVSPDIEKDNKARRGLDGLGVMVMGAGGASDPDASAPDNGLNNTFFAQIQDVLKQGGLVGALGVMLHVFSQFGVDMPISGLGAAFAQAADPSAVTADSPQNQLDTAVSAGVALDSAQGGGSVSVSGSVDGANVVVAAETPVPPQEQEAAEKLEQRTVPRPEFDMSKTPEGMMLYDYVMETIIEGNGQAQYRDVPPDVLAMMPGIKAAKVAGMTPEDMHAAVMARVEDDIRAGTFPYGNFAPEQAVEKAQQIADTLRDYALEHGHTIRRSSRDFDNNLSLTFTVDEKKLKMGIDALFSGENPTFPLYAQHGLKGDYFKDVYVYLRDEKNYGASLSAEALNEHFDKLLKGHTALNGQDIPPALDIPEHMHARFHLMVERAFDKSREGGGFDGRVFGQVMEKAFGVLDVNGVSVAMRVDVLEHGQPVAAKIGDALENGDIQITAPDGTPLFALTNPEAGYAVYATDGRLDSFSFDEADIVDDPSDIARLFGEDFQIRVASTPDPDTSARNVNPVAYYVETRSGNSFYIGFDAIAETGVTEDFRNSRSHNIDTERRAIEPSLDSVVAGPRENRPSIAEFNM